MAERTTNSPRSGGNELIAIIVVAVVVRVAALAFLDSASIASTGDAWTMGHESACVARSIAEGNGCGDPWGKGTGASGWLTPIYPALMAACMLIGGGVNAVSAVLLFSLQILFSTLTCAGLVFLGRNLGLARAGRLSAWILVVLPASIWNSVQVVWDTTLVSCAVTFFLVEVTRQRQVLDLRRATSLGLAFGALVMLNPASASLLPATIWFLQRQASSVSGSGALRPASMIAFAGAALFVCLPWMTRNRVVLGSWSLRTNLGVELRVGNNDEAYGRHEVAYHPSHTEDELERYLELGEVEYSRQSRASALRWMQDNPADFVRLTLRRMYLFWFSDVPAFDPRYDETVPGWERKLSWTKWSSHMLLGLLALGALATWRGSSRRGGVGRGVPGTFGLFLLVALIYPLPYYFTHVTERYRFAVEPLFLFLAVNWLAHTAACRVRELHSDETTRAA